MKDLLDDHIAECVVDDDAAPTSPAAQCPSPLHGRRSSLRRRVLFPALALCASLLLAAASAEIALRVAGYGRSYTNPMGSFFVPDSETGYHGKPNFTGRFRRADFDVTVEHDENGFRRGEHIDAADPHGLPSPSGSGAGGEEIYVLGDSFVWGYGIGQRDLLTNQMARLLGRRVHNLGLIGAGTVQEWLIFQKHVAARLRLRDTVVLVFFGNDFGDNVGKHLKGRVYATIAGGQIQLVPPPPPSAMRQWKSWMKDASCLFNLATYCIDRLQDARASKDLFDRAARRVLSAEEVRADTADGSPAVQIMRHYLAELRDACRAKQARFLAVFVPGQAELGEDDLTSTSDLCLAEESASREAFDRIAGDLGIETVDLMAPMRAAKRSSRFERMTFIHDFHWNAAGNTVASEVIAGRIAECEHGHAFDPK
jgi:hypothetical protein